MTQGRLSSFFALLVMVFFVASVAVSCGQVDRGRGSITITSQSPSMKASSAENDVRCSNEEPSPITATRAVNALRAFGFTIFPVPDPVCAPQLVTQLSNTLFRGPNVNVPSHDAITSREGQLICDVETGLSPAARDRPWDARTFDDGAHGVEVNVANVSCVLFAPAAKNIELVEKLEEALRSLGKTSR